MMREKTRKKGKRKNVNGKRYKKRNGKEKKEHRKRV